MFIYKKGIKGFSQINFVISSLIKLGEGVTEKCLIPILFGLLRFVKGL